MLPAWIATLSAAVKPISQYAAIGGLIETGNYILAGAGWNNVKKEATYLGNAKLPNNFPSPQHIIAGYHAGILDPQVAHESLLIQGVNLFGVPNTPTVEYATKCWKAVERLMLPYPTLEFAYQAYARGVISEERHKEIRKIHADRYGTMEGMLDYVRQPIDVTNLILAWQRGNIGDDIIDRNLKKATGWTDADIATVRRNFYVIPPISDQIRFVVREAFNDELARQLGLDAEFGDNPNFKLWVEASGLKPIPAGTVRGQNEPVDWGRMYWRAHWELPSPTQAYVMLHRLRPGAENRFQQGGLRPEPVTEDDVRRLLKAADYAPMWRDRLTAISYHPLTRVDIRRIYFEDGIDEKEVYEANRDLGYDDRNAKIITDWLKEEKKKKKEREKDRKTARTRSTLASRIVNAYRYGAITRQSAFAGLTKIKIDEENANYMLDSVDFELETKTVQVFAESIRKEYFLGLYTSTEAYAELVAAGISHKVATKYMERWNRQLRVPRRVASANTVLSWFRAGLIQEEEVLLRLHNLGYTNIDRMLYLQSAKLDIEKARLREQAATARNEKQRAAASKRALDAAKREHLERRRELQRLFGEDDAKRWYIMGLWREEDVRKALTAIDFTPEAIEIRLKEWDITKGVT